MESGGEEDGEDYEDDYEDDDDYVDMVSENWGGTYEEAGTFEHEAHTCNSYDDDDDDNDGEQATSEHESHASNSYWFHYDDDDHHDDEIPKRQRPDTPLRGFFTHTAPPTTSHHHLPPDQATAASLLHVTRSTCTRLSHLRRAFKLAARQTHPDKNPTDVHAKEKFQKVTWAFELLKKSWFLLES